MGGKFETAAVIAMIAAATSPCTADPCHGDAQNGVYSFQLTPQPDQAPINAKATLAVTARPPGLTFMPAANAKIVNGGFGATYVKVFFDVYSAGLAPTGVEVIVYYPQTLTSMPRVTLSGPFGGLNAQASRPAPIFNDVVADYALTQAQLRSFSPGTQLGVTVFDQDGTLLELGTFDVADLATMKTLGDAAADNFKKNCAANQ
jgi:hypothetical protein